MTEEEFKNRTGRAPTADELEFTNCSKAGEVGHQFCGWCEDHDGPVSRCGCGADNVTIALKQ